MKNRFFIAAGGTGGHILPALAIYYKLVSQLDFVKFICRKKDTSLINELNNIEQNLLFLNAIGFKRKFSYKNIIAGYWVVLNIIKSFYWFIKFKPEVVIGMGGYITFPVLLWASILKKNIFLFEQNSIPGMVNKLFYKKADAVFVNFEYTKKFIPEAILVNNPIRKSISKKISEKEAYKFFGFKNKLPVIMIAGGSQGAKIINSSVAEIINKLVENFNVIWITGRNMIDDYSKFGKLKNLFIEGFLENMNYAYSIADLVISRAGSMSVTEMCYFEVPAILIPLKIATANHQYFNAKSLSDRGAAVIIEEKFLTSKILFDKINDLFKTGKIKSMKMKIKDSYIKNSDEIILQEIKRRIEK